MINKNINGYTIKHLIGSGGMADVYYSENSLGLPAAIKVLKLEYSNHEQVQERFVHEARIMKSLDHIHIRKVMDMGTIDGRAAIILEYLEGQSLKEAIQLGQKIHDSTLQIYFDECVQALMYTHSRNITHRDIKPSNIFITLDNIVKLVDFGIAKSELMLSNTITGQTLGTILYMSPEQILDPKRVYGKTDIYSLGVTFYHALTGMAPYDASAGSEFKIQQKIVYEDLDLSKIPAHWKGVLSGCLLKKPEERSTLKMINFDGDTIVDPLTSRSKPPAIKSKVQTKWFYYILGGITIIITLIIGIQIKDKQAGDKGLIVYEDELGFFGYKDRNGNIVISAKFETASPFNKQRAKVSVADSVYYINEEGRLEELIKSTLYESESKNELNNITSEDNAFWLKAKTANTVSSFEKYILQYPDGLFVNEAKAKMKDILAERRDIKTYNVPGSYEYVVMVNLPGKSYKLSKYEVTIAQYLAFCKAVDNHWPQWLETDSEWNISFGPRKDYLDIGMSPVNYHHPVTGISLFDAESFCKWMGGRLPTESEWEYSANGGGGFEYAGSNDINKVAWHRDNGNTKTHPVGGKKANGYQLFDMSGNVSEWTSTKDGSGYVIRGGSFLDDSLNCRVTSCHTFSPEFRSVTTGFRMAVDE